MSSQSDFDFFIGNWNVHNRRLKNPLRGSTDWYEFEASSKAKKIWGGLANMDEFVGDSPLGLIQGMTVRLFDPATRQWRLYWANRKDGLFGVPTIGEFKDGRGEFFDQELFEGRSIFVRYEWSDIMPTSCRWQQAFSADGGRTWETNWIMDFTRV
ncbi:MAG: hypothetical protein ACXVA3_01330 [Vulcanimicrobiaceae bacterium]